MRFLFFQIKSEISLAAIEFCYFCHFFVSKFKIENVDIVFLMLRVG